MKNMSMHQLDPDVVRWGLHLIDVCSLANNNGSPQPVTCYFSRTESGKQDSSHLTHSVVENDQVIAQALQEELSKLDAAEEQQHQKASIIAQDWLGPSERHFHSDCQSNNQGEEGKDKAILSKIGNLSIEMEDQDHLPEMECKSALDGEVGKRLNHMVPVPHVPKINGEIPSVDEATSVHERLSNRLQLYDLVELKISGDGNCQFRALSDQIYRTPEHHKFVREQVVNQLKSRAEVYKNYVPMAYGEYMKKMRKYGEWGDHVTLQAAADRFGIKIFIITSFKDTCYIEILPQTRMSERSCSYMTWSNSKYREMFRALSDQIYRTPEHHKFVREQVVNQLKSRAEVYKNYVPMAYGEYMKKMRKYGEWGDHVTLQAAADRFGIKIFIITSFKDTCYIEILPQTRMSERTIFLSFWAEVHYNSIYPLGELPMVENKRKKRWWW